MRIISQTLVIGELKRMAEEGFGNMVKAVVDTERRLIAVDADLHSDLEAALLNDGSKQKYLWGINLYPGLQEDSFIEFDSMINLRPSQGNKSRGVDDEDLRREIAVIVAERIKR
ncbi:MAG: hypothetical protein GX598_05360 [Elusimicrobia bacterium]|jgi:hypothetical protein|nr:hypothetical protein [Elusimicrobiota bacterium]